MLVLRIMFMLTCWVGSLRAFLPASILKGARSSRVEQQLSGRQQVMDVMWVAPVWGSAVMFVELFGGCPIRVMRENLNIMCSPKLLSYLEKGKNR